MEIEPNIPIAFLHILINKLFFINFKRMKTSPEVVEVLLGDWRIADEDKKKETSFFLEFPNGRILHLFSNIIEETNSPLANIEKRVNVTRRSNNYNWSCSISIEEFKALTSEEYSDGRKCDAKTYSIVFNEDHEETIVKFL